MPLTVGEPAPWFKAPTASEPEFAFEGAAGRFILLAFLPLDDDARLKALKALAAHQSLFDLNRLVAFVVVRDAGVAATARDLRAMRWVLDLDFAVSRQFEAGHEAGGPSWIVLDPTLRVYSAASLDQTDAVFDVLRRLPAPTDHARTIVHAPVLILPRVFEPELCEQLIALHATDGGAFSGVMRDQGPRTVAVMDALKRRRDITLQDPELIATLRDRMDRRLLPMIERALGFTVTRIERFLVSCYDAAEGGVFAPHRDSNTQGTAHRKFACSINLNADFDGGDLRFPEFGLATYRPPLGGAVVFSCALMHEARPITRGRRYAFLPFLHDEDGQAVLDAYNARVSELSRTAS